LFIKSLVKQPKEHISSSDPNNIRCEPDWGRQNEAAQVGRRQAMYDHMREVQWKESQCKEQTNVEREEAQMDGYHIKEIPALYKFKNTLKTFLLEHCFYSIDEFLLFVDKA
jgi:hypothetical protein